MPSSLPWRAVELRKLYYDLAGAPVPELLQAIFDIADPNYTFYGSDWPFTPVKLCAELAAQLDASSQLAGGLLPKIMTGNAQSFFPQLEHKG